MSSSAVEVDIVNLLKFPSISNGAFSNYKSGLNVIASDTIIPRAVSGSSSPPRKTARLEGDEDHSAAASRSRDKGKGREILIDRTPIAKTKIGIVRSPHEPISQTYLDSLQGPLHLSICVVLDWRPNELDIQKRTPLSYEKIYQATRSLVLTAGKGHWVYDKLRFELTECVKKIANTLIKLEPPDKIMWLVQLVDAANWYDICISRLQDLLTYLDRVYIPTQLDMLNIRQLAESVFQKFILQHGLMTDYLKQGIISWAERERTDRKIHPQRPTIIALLDMLHTYGLLTPLFLNTYIFTTENYYKSESEALAKTEEYKEPNKFLEHVSKRIEEEKQRSTVIFVRYEWCARSIEGSTEKSLMKGRLDWLSKGIITAIDASDMGSLSRIYKLFARVDGLKLLCDEFKLHVNNIVEKIVKDVAKDDSMIDRLLAFKAFIDSALAIAFCDEASVGNQAKLAPSATNNDKPEPSKISNQRFIYAATDAFQAGFRARRNKPAEMIAKHIDRAMRKGQQDASDAEFSKMLDAILVLYRFTQDRDVFRTFYHRALAKRLLLQRSASDDSEKVVLKRLKEHYDPEFGMGDQMFRDLALSRDIMTEFHSKPVGSGAGQQLTVMVLQRSFWPFSAKQREEILLPPAMQEVLTKYSIFYRNAHQGHKLDFDHSLGTMQLRAQFKAGEKELSVSLYQGVILLLFNEEDEIAFPEIKESTKMDDQELRRTLQSLACGNKKVLKKRPVGKDVNIGDVFYFNNDFTDPRQKVHINSIQSKETPEETERTQQSIEGDRKHYIDAAIVRIMKAKKTMAHQKLIQETIEAVKGHFKPEVKVMKERIEQLIEQEYMRREDEQDNVYVYIA